jgi:hypothetical protein
MLIKWANPLRWRRDLGRRGAVEKADGDVYLRHACVRVQARRVWARMVDLEALEQRRQQARTGHTPHVLEQLAQIEARHLAIWGDAASGGGAEAAAPYPSSSADWREVARELRPPPGVAQPTRDALDVDGHSGGGGSGGGGGGVDGDIGGGASAGLASLASALGGVRAEERGGAPSP